MTHYDAVPTDLEEWFEEFVDEEDLEEYLRDLTRDLLSYHRERSSMHDKDGFFAELAYDPKCAALGHERSKYEEGQEPLDDDEEFEPVYDDELSRDGTHVSGFDGDMICLDTRYGACCTFCEGECSYSSAGPNLWTLPGVSKEN